ncbi:MAG TPA: pilus assembly protein TadG-related protein [Pirellulaceae bacterium]|nr:pilus assembly protein TadG-related protein [Pirellulaceae bacterium]
MKRKLLNRRPGNIAILSSTLLAIMMGMVAFAVDLGYVAQARTELQRTADAVALAAAAKLPSLDAARTVGIATAQSNTSTISPTLSNGNFEFGHWSRKTSTFTTPTPAYRSTNAVRVTIKRTQANGNPLNLFYGRVLGKQTTDVTVTAVGFNDRGLCGPFIGITSADIGGNMHTDSYDSDDGSYDAASASYRGSVCSDGDVKVHGDAEIYGDARAGTTGEVTVDGNPVITGNIGNRIKPLDLPSVDASPYADPNNDNDLLPEVLRLNEQGNGNHWVSPVDNQGDFKLNAGDVYNMPAGTYYFRDMLLNGGAILNITGDVTIYVTRDLTFNGGSYVNNLTEKADSLTILMTGGVASITFGSPFYGVLYAPDTDVTISGDADVYGAVVANNLKVTGNALGHYDESLEMEMADPPNRTTIVD